MAKLIRCCHCAELIPVGRRACPRCGRPLLVARQFRLLHPIGVGGFATVFLAAHIREGFLCAVKRLDFAKVPPGIARAEAAMLQRRLRRLAFVPQIYTTWADDSALYIVMELIEGVPLNRWSAGPWSAASVHEFLATMLLQLDQLHRTGVIHRDIKPANIIRSPRGDLFLVDFGLARHLAEDTSMVWGAATPAYAPPEQLGGQRMSQRSDLYSLAATAYTLLTGRPPAPAADRIAGAALLRPSGLAPGVSRRLEQALLQMLALDPLARPSSARAALRILGLPRGHSAAAGAGLPRLVGPGASFLALLLLMGFVGGLIALLT